MAQETAVPASASPAEIRRHELAAFLRHRREHIAPEQVGLPRGRRRRTPGLRREEVAQLSAVGVTWYTWLEQARDIQVSVQVLDALARALLLDPSERSHLFQLAGAVDPTPATVCPSITPAIRQVLAQLEPVPVSHVRDVGSATAATTSSPTTAPTACCCATWTRCRPRTATA